MKTKYFLIFTLCFCFQITFGQRHCATDELHKHKMQQNPELYKAQEDYKLRLNQIIARRQTQRLAGATDIYTIPVVVHIIYNNNSSTNISDAQVLSQIDVLNEDYRRKTGTPGFNTNPVGDDPLIEFCLASSDPSGNFTTGINRVYNAQSQWDPIAEESTLKGLIDWPSDKYLNIWVTKLSNGYLGYAQFPVGATVPGPSGSTPAMDGVVIDYRAFGRIGTAGTGGYSLYNMGRTTTHEVGHWLGLVHIWGDGSGCTTDYINDTPLDAAPNQDNDCKDSSDCDGDLVYTQDMTSNYLDYSPDVCMNVFTADQKTRMRTVIETAPLRMSLLNSTACCIPSQPEQIPFSEDFEDGVTQKYTIQNPDAGKTWEITSTAGGFGESSQCIFVENDISPAGQADTLVSAYMKFTDVEPGLEFDLAYAKNSTPQSDCLVVSYSLNCTTWTPIYTLYGNQLTTTSRITDNFVPNSDEWRKIRIDLDPLNFQPVGRIRFENYSNNVNNLYIDNINIYKTSPSLIVTPYPNPTSGILHVDVILDNIDNVKYELFDVLGQKIFEEMDFEKTSYTKTFDLSGLAQGLYILRVRDRKQSASRKIIYSY